MPLNIGSDCAFLLESYYSTTYSVLEDFEALTSFLKQFGTFSRRVFMLVFSGIHKWGKNHIRSRSVTR
jgi:hypothetical protein